MEWRRCHQDVLPDLSGTNFNGSDLSEAELFKANLSGATLSKTDLSEADLSEANLIRANLSEADLSEAELFRTNLSEANLSKADFKQSDLTEANLSKADLTKADFSEAELYEANLSGANLSSADLEEIEAMLADLSGANLVKANLSGAGLRWAKVRGADLRKANLSGADLTGTDLTGSNLTGANLKSAILIRTNLNKADLTGCYVYGLSVWDVQLRGAIQKDLVITPDYDPTITVDNLEVAQFIYLLLNNEQIRHVIDTITSKVVLILGRFTPERKVVLDAIRDELRKRDYLPVLFDFEKPDNRDITETVSTLAHMAKFVIADITDAKSIPQELMAIVPALPSVPVQPLLLASQREYGMFEHFKRYPWVLEPFLYQDQDGLLAALNDNVIGPAEAKAKEQTGP